MNRNLKFAIAAAIASLGVTGQAHALTNSTATTSGSLFLYVFEDRVGTGSNSAATNSAIFDLGLASAFDATSNQTFDFSASAGWTNYIATIANPANIHWGVFGSAYGNGGTNTQFLTTLSVVPPYVNGSLVNGVVTHYNALITNYGSNDGFAAVMPNDLASAYWDDNAGFTAMGTTTAGLGSNLDFFKYTSTGTKATNLAIQTTYSTTFSLSNNGVLTVTAVPEADSYAMMLAGLGLVGFMVRRRKAA